MLQMLSRFTNQLPTAHVRTYVIRRPVTKHAVPTNCLPRMFPEAPAPTQKCELGNQQPSAKAGCVKRLGTMQVRTLV